MREIAKKLLEYLTEENVRALHEHDRFDYPKEIWDLIKWVYDAGHWDGKFREKYEGLMKRDISGLELHEVYTYLTAIVCIERCFNGYVFQNCEDGIIQALMKRYLELTEDEAE